jgi:ABC-type Fe3+/spermidine/putrescine transport system ATPase subunit
MENSCEAELRSAAKVYGKAAAILDVNLKIFAREFLSIIGGKRQGKTTILRAIA